MLSEPGLVDALWKNPSDRALLAVIADHFAEQGDATRAEYLQLALLSVRTKKQERRMDSLLKRHGRSWLGAASKWVAPGWDEDPHALSFARRVTCSVRDLAQGFETIRLLGPRLVVQLRPCESEEEEATLARLELGRLHGLHLSWPPKELLLRLAPRLRGLREFEVRGSAQQATWRRVFAADGSRKRRSSFAPRRSRRRSKT